MFEAVNGLVIVTYNAYSGIIGKKFDYTLFRFVQILKFVHEDMLEFTSLSSCWIGSKVFIQLWNDFANQHCTVK